MENGGTGVCERGHGSFRGKDARERERVCARACE
jgi:hypothetical protein